MYNSIEMRLLFWKKICWKICFYDKKSGKIDKLMIRNYMQKNCWQINWLTQATYHPQFVVKKGKFELGRQIVKNYLYDKVSFWIKKLSIRGKILKTVMWSDSVILGN